MASHDGRWTLAALRAGASHVTGIEARPELVKHAVDTLDSYDVSHDSYRFVTGDIFEVLADPDFEVDVIQCFGFLYHTLRYPELLSSLARMEPRHLLLDTKVWPTQERVIRLGVDDAGNEGQAAADAYTGGTKTLVGSPSQGALRMMLRVYGFQVEAEHDWRATIERYGEGAVKSYAQGERVSWRARFVGIGAVQTRQRTGAPLTASIPPAADGR